MDNFAKKRASREVPGQEVLGPRDLQSRDLSRDPEGPGTKKFQNLKIGKVPGKWKPYTSEDFTGNKNVNQSIHKNSGSYGILISFKLHILMTYIYEVNKYVAYPLHTVILPD